MSAKTAGIAICHIAYGLGCIAIGVLLLTGTIRVHFAGVFEWAAFLGGAFMIWFGAMAFWWADE